MTEVQKPADPMKPATVALVPAPAVTTAALEVEQIQKALEPELVETYKRMLSFQFGGALVLVAILAGGLLSSFLISGGWQVPIMVLVTLAGMLGAFFSALTRLYDIDRQTVAWITPTVNQLRGIYLMMYSSVPPLVGAVAAVVLYVVFVGDFLGSGGLFPAMSCRPSTKSCDSLATMLNDYGPVSAKDYGKVLVWAFIAGFSERFVPDTLQSFVTRSRNSDQTSRSD